MTHKFTQTSLTSLKKSENPPIIEQNFYFDNFFSSLGFSVALSLLVYIKMKWLLYLEMLIFLEKESSIWHKNELFKKH